MVRRSVTSLRYFSHTVLIIHFENVSHNLLYTASKNVSHNVSHNFSQTDTPYENVSHNTSLKVQQTKQDTRTEGRVAPRSSSK